MKARVVATGLALVVFLVLAALVIQRLSAEAMAVFVGVVAGVVASIPTSLIVAWFALRAAQARTETLSRAVAESHPAEPRIVVVSPSLAPAPPAYGAAPYPYPASASALALSPYAQPPERRFTVIGGTDVTPVDAADFQEASWQR